MRQPRWVERLVVDAVHWDQIREHGGLAGVRDEGALESALARPRHKWHYQETTELTTLAAAYGFGLCRNHPYRDGNKRVAFVIMVTFLELNGSGFKAEETEVVTVMLALAGGKLSERELANWLQAHCTKSKGRGTR
ncbi:MAG: type II toxin-antitoxin system death-on-curing family toxin [Gemmatimonadetes bacterium]|nr:type II toxin-antitoxin system death-on-curing family toxin [Gemmatimonadota bacterium]MBI2616094.1 type II toxin-antitoxin system death-on-curing family toxin [Gemmatimonadota bacterium]